jgi:hypothetical protein
MLQDIKLTYRKAIEFLYSNNELYKKEIKKTIPFIIASKNIMLR